MSSLKQGNLGDVLRAALEKLHQEEQFDKYLKYLNSEWYYTADDLRLARSDEKVWAEIKFPGRLKIEIANILDDAAAVEADQEDDQLQQPEPEQQFDETAAAEYAPAEEYPTWVKCWAAEHECYYYYNMSTQESSWEDPYEGSNTVYDVYQYNDETQQWEIVEDNTSAYYNAYSNTESNADAANAFAVADHNTPTYSPKGSQKTIFHAESKYSDLADAHEEQAKPSPRTASTTSTTFTRPKSTPRTDNNGTIDTEDRLFVASPNRPKSLKSNRTPEYKRSPNYRTMGANHKNSPLPDTPPGVGRGSPNASIQARHKVRARPARLNTQELSSESDSDNNVNHSPVHIVRAVKPHNNRHPEHRQTDAAALQKGAISARAEDKVREAREHSPMMSKPVGRPVGAHSLQPSPKSNTTTRSSTALNSTRSINSVSVSLIDADTKAVHSAYDWDSKHNDTVDSEHNPVGDVGKNNTNNDTGAEEPYDYYKDYDNTEAEYDASQHQAVDRNAEYVVQNQLGAYIDVPVGGFSSHDQQDDHRKRVPYIQKPQESEGTYDEEGNHYSNYDQSSKTYYDGAEYNAADYDAAAYDYDNSAEYNAADYDANAEYNSGAEYNDCKDSDYEYPEDAYYDHATGTSYDGADYNFEQYLADHTDEASDKNKDKRLSKGTYHLTDPATIERVVENSYYNHASIPSAPPSEVHTAAIPAFSPRSQGAAMYKDSPHTGSARYRDYKSDTPGTPNRDSWSPAALSTASPVRSPVAMPVSATAVADEYYITEATVEAEGGGDLMALAMGSPGTPGDTPQQAPKVKQRSTISKLFRMNLFGGKGPALPSTPPPPRDSTALDPHSSAYRHQLQQERRAAKQNSKSAGGKAVDSSVTHHTINSEVSGGSGGYGGASVYTGANTGSNSTNKATAAHSSYGGHLNDGNVRRKPAPAAADSTNAVNARQKFYAAHAVQSQKHYKYHDRIREIENRNRGSPSSKQEELHYRNLQKLLDMGFGEHESIMALSMCEDNLIEASQMLVETHNNA